MSLYWDSWKKKPEIVCPSFCGTALSQVSVITVYFLILLQAAVRAALFHQFVTSIVAHNQLVTFTTWHDSSCYHTHLYEESINVQVIRQQFASVDEPLVTHSLETKQE